MGEKEGKTVEVGTIGALGGKGGQDSRSGNNRITGGKGARQSKSGQSEYWRKRVQGSQGPDNQYWGKGGQGNRSWGNQSTGEERKARQSKSGQSEHWDKAIEVLEGKALGVGKIGILGEKRCKAVEMGAIGQDGRSGNNWITGRKGARQSKSGQSDYWGKECKAVKVEARRPRQSKSGQ